jgi:hypothetical protein
MALPLIYGTLGFFSGAIGALLYNFCAKWMGGLELELEEARRLKRLDIEAFRQ